MTALAPTLQSWFIDHLIGQRDVSPNTIAAYRDCMRLLLCYAHERHGVQPAQLDFTHLDDQTIAGFLDMLEHQRHVGVATRNARLAAIHSLFRYASFRHPENAELIARVLAIPTKIASRTDVVYLDDDEVDAVLAAPDRRTWSGQRDHAWLLLMITTGIRVGELVSLRRLDLTTGRSARIVVVGKGRKERTLPLDKTTTAIVTDWMRAIPAPPEAPPLSRPESQRSNEHRRHRATRDAPRRERRRPGALPQGQDGYSSRAEAHLRYEDAGKRPRHHHHLPLARPRISGRHPALPPCRSCAQATGPRTHRTAAHEEGALHPDRQGPGVPRTAVNYAELHDPIPAETRLFQPKFGITATSG